MFLQTVLWYKALVIEIWDIFINSSPQANQQQCQRRFEKHHSTRGSSNDFIQRHVIYKSLDCGAPRWKQEEEWETKKLGLWRSQKTCAHCSQGTFDFIDISLKMFVIERMHKCTSIYAEKIILFHFLNVNWLILMHVAKVLTCVSVVSWNSFYWRLRSRRFWCCRELCGNFPFSKFKWRKT